MMEMSISEAQSLWQNRLSNNCRDRIASGCDNTFNIYRTCNIIHCPRLREAKLRMIIKFEEEE